MLHPGTDETDRRCAAAYAAHFRNRAYRAFLRDGGTITPEIEASLAENDELASDLKRRWRAGLAVGDLVKVLFGLMQDRPELASWNHAISTVSPLNKQQILPASVAHLWAAKSEFLSVAHLWGAYCVREGKFEHRPEIGYGLDADFQYFLYEAELLRHYGRNYYQDRDKAEPFLPDEAWHVPYEWEGPEGRAEWPELPGQKLAYVLQPELISHLRPGGRPKGS
jgi:hypothetical protein